jgi:hypothetical protein
VSVTNPLESSVEIVDLFRSPVGTAAFAYPQSNPGILLATKGSADLDYRLDPPGADAADVDPMLRVAVHTDLAALLPKVLLNRGYASDTFVLSVHCDPGFFGGVPPGGTEPLTALRVYIDEDDEDQAVVLTAMVPTVSVAVRIPILPWLLKAPDAEQCRYRVTNLHGMGNAVHAGAVGDWVEHRGAGTLTVTPVGA